MIPGPSNLPDVTDDMRALGAYHRAVKALLTSRGIDTRGAPSVRAYFEMGASVESAARAICAALRRRAAYVVAKASAEVSAIDNFIKGAS